MGKDWDKAVPSVDIWRECLRVLKPGAFAFVMSGPRMDCLSEMGKRLAEAGLETGFTPIFWAFASGFPKAGNMGKLVDKRLGANQAREFYEHPNRQGRSYNTIIGFEVGTARNRGDSSAYMRGIATTPEAQALDGSYAGFQPKPAVEVVIVAMKPLAHGTYIDQALDNQKGVTWLDDGRIPYDMDKETRARGANTPQYTSGIGFQGTKKDSQTGNPLFKLDTGRFPANLLVSDDVVDDGSERTSGQLLPHHKRAEKRNVYGKYSGADWSGKYFGGDSGSFSRYFSLDKWWQAKLSELPESVQRTFPFLVVPKAGKKEKNLGCEGLPQKEIAIGNTQIYERSGSRKPPQTNYLKRGNNHRTVKPLKLMSYLITLGSRPGDLVLDPFAGTCTTGMAAKMLGRNYLMIEIDEQWCRIGRRRVDVVQERML